MANRVLKVFCFLLATVAFASYGEIDSAGQALGEAYLLQQRQNTFSQIRKDPGLFLEQSQDEARTVAARLTVFETLLARDERNLLGLQTLLDRFGPGADVRGLSVERDALPRIRKTLSRMLRLSSEVRLQAINNIVNSANEYDLGAEWNAQGKAVDPLSDQLDLVSRLGGLNDAIIYGGTFNDSEDPNMAPILEAASKVMPAKILVAPPGRFGFFRSVRLGTITRSTECPDLQVPFDPDLVAKILMSTDHKKIRLVCQKGTKGIRNLERQTYIEVLVHFNESRTWFGCGRLGLESCVSRDYPDTLDVVQAIFKALNEPTPYVFDDYGGLEGLDARQIRQVN